MIIQDFTYVAPQTNTSLDNVDVYRLKLLIKANGMKMMDCTLPHENGQLGKIFKHDLANQTFLCCV